MGTSNFQAKTLGYSLAVGYATNDTTDDDRDEGDAVDFLTAINSFLWEAFFKNQVHTQPLLVAYEKGRFGGWRLAVGG